MNSTTIQLEWSSLPCSSRGEGIDGFFVIAESLGAKVEEEKKNKVRNSRPFAKVHRHRWDDSLFVVFVGMLARSRVRACV